MRVLSRAPFFLIPLLVTTSRVDAQTCFGPDVLQGPCCQTTLAALPQFPALTLPGLGVCWTQCSLDSQSGITAALGPPTAVSCGVYAVPFSATITAAPAQVLSGAMRLDYTRTWVESAVVGAPPVQVWRFAAKVDLSLSPTPPQFLCPVPGCLPGAQTAFYYGYVDFASSCPSGTPPVWEAAVVLFHNCDSFIHTPGLSSRPGAFHPGRTYAIVAPHSSSAPFVPTANLFPNGPLIAEALRDVAPAGAPTQCRFEERLSSGVQQRIGFGCLCPLAGNTFRTTANILNGKDSCPDTITGAVSSFTSINVPNTSWIHDMKWSLGCWAPSSGSQTYPGNECAFVDEGVFVYHSSCTPVSGGFTGVDFVEIFYGGSTTFGWMPASLDPGITLSDRFIDMASNYSAPLLGPYPSPVAGNVLPTTHLFYVNVP